ncbi:MAG TPA: S8 family serine peptidase [Gaiellaceae bacterium]|nr:S8 family serine peptidase [Gaiellaceae bacterium]
MPLTAEKLEELIFGTERFRRFTQDSPVMPDVWIAYGLNPDAKLDLLLTPHVEASAPELGHALRQRLGGREMRQDQPAEVRVAYNESYVVAELDFDELVKVALPLTHWWRDHVWRTKADLSDVEQLRAPAVKKRVAAQLADAGPSGFGGDVSPDLLWLMRVVGRIELERRGKRTKGEPSNEQLVEAVLDLIAAGDVAEPPPAPLLWRVDRNRPASPAISRSILAVKADAAVRLFDLNCRELRWAVVDSGIDATHPAFRKRDEKGDPYPDAFESGRRGSPASNRTRIVATYDFTRLRRLLNPDADLGEYRLSRDDRARVNDFRRALKAGRAIDWLALEPLLSVPHEPKEYVPPAHEHGTHVAGILTADWRVSDDGMPNDESMLGVAAGLEVYDLRVLDEDGHGDEFSLIAALQFVRYLNANKDRVLVHGVNVSLSIRHDVANYACGRTPVCEECERLVGAGTVVVAAAGNEGYARFQTTQGDPSEGYRSISITDPGNAESVITVGATHRFQPHSYGVSYFSSRGPTGDGRLKPDLVAPGEKITAPIPGRRLNTMDGTSMAAPHVSAAAALLMARYHEFIGQPERIKQVLCENATDLGRERYFQGNGMLDVLRALQAV